MAGFVVGFMSLKVENGECEVDALSARLDEQMIG